MPPQGKTLWKSFVLRKGDYMRKIFCPYCGEPLTNNCDCDCEFGIAMEEERTIEEIEERHYGEDYPEIAYVNGCYVCPICESEFETDENDKGKF